MRQQGLPILTLKLVLGVFLAWVGVGVVGIILVVRSPGALRLGESDIRISLLKFRKALKGRTPADLDVPPLWAVSGQHAMPARGPNLHPVTREVVYASAAADTGKWAYDKGSGRVFIDCTHTDSRGSAWSAY